MLGADDGTRNRNTRRSKEHLLADATQGLVPLRRHRAAADSSCATTCMRRWAVADEAPGAISPPQRFITALNDPTRGALRHLQALDFPCSRRIAGHHRRRCNQSELPRVVTGAPCRAPITNLWRQQAPLSYCGAESGLNPDGGKPDEALWHFASCK